MNNNKTLKNTLGVAAVALILAACGDNTENTATTDTATPEVVVETAVVETAVETDATEQAEAITETLLLESTEVTSETFTVESFDAETKTAILFTEDGEKRTVIAGEEANNLDQIKPGVQVLVEFLKTISVEIVSDKNLQADIIVIEEVDRAAEGEKAAIEAIEASIVIYKIEEINLEDNTYKLKGPDGTVNQYTALNPENLTKGAVGDAVVLTVVDAVSISLVEESAETEVAE